MLEWARDGWAKYENAIGDAALAHAEQVIASLYYMQACKIVRYRERVTALADATPREKVCGILEMMEADDKGPLYQVQKFFPHHMELRDDLFGRLTFELRKLLNTEGEAVGPNQCLIEGPALFVNRPDTERLLYKWHTEAHYYPKRRRFINIWIPIFGDRSAENGAMSIIPGTHVRSWDFVEYSGYNLDTLGRKDHFLQYEVPETMLLGVAGLEESVEARRGDAIVFHRNLIHRSNRNASGDYAFAIVGRFWTPVNDLTLAGDMPVQPYGGDPGGRPGLFVGGPDYE